MPVHQSSIRSHHQQTIDVIYLKVLFLGLYFRVSVLQDARGDLFLGSVDIVPKAFVGVLRDVQVCHIFVESFVSLILIEKCVLAVRAKSLPSR